MVEVGRNVVMAKCRFLQYYLQQCSVKKASPVVHALQHMTGFSFEKCLHCCNYHLSNFSKPITVMQATGMGDGNRIATVFSGSTRIPHC